MSHPDRRLPILLLVILVMVACGKKGPPLAPIAIVATGTTDLIARRLGSQVYLQFTIPVRDVMGETPADIESVELYGLTGEPFEFPPTPIDDETFLEFATLIETIDVRPPPPPIEPGEIPQAPPAPLPDAPVDNRPGQGDVLTLSETLTPEALEPVDFDFDQDDDEDEDDRAPTWIPALWPPFEASQLRYYVVVARNRRGQASSAVTRVRMPLDPAPPPPESLALQYSNDSILLSWQPPEQGPVLIQDPVVPLVAPVVPVGEVPAVPLVPELLPLESTPVSPQRSLYGYNVYDPRAVPNADGRVAPLNLTPLVELSFIDDRLDFGVERCYVVLTVEPYAELEVEGELATQVPVCVQPVDSFRPAAPTRLVAVGSAGAISLLWDTNTEEDVAGYIVLRGEAPGDTLQPITPELVEDPTFRDTATEPGVRYVYAILAVDSASNVSLESNRVEETAR